MLTDDKIRSFAIQYSPSSSFLVPVTSKSSYIHKIKYLASCRQTLAVFTGT